MKQQKRFKARLTNLAMLTLILLAQITSPVLSIAQTIDSQEKTELVSSSEQEEVEKKKEEPEKAAEPQAAADSEDVQDAESSSESANANDSPVSEQVEEPELKTDSLPEEEAAEINLEKIDQLASRPSPTKYDTSGLTDAEIEQLGLKIFGEYQPFGASVTMDNDSGEAINIPFKFMRQTREIGMKRAFNMSYVLTGFGTTSRYPTIGHHYLDSRYAFCMDPNTLFQNGANYAPQEMDISNQTYKNVNDVLNFGATDDSNDIASGYTQLLVWSRIGWDVTEVAGIGSLDGFRAYQAEVESKIQQWYRPASFDGSTITLKVGESATLTDTNNSLSQMVIDSNTTGTAVTKNGNQLTIRANSNTNTDGSITLSKENKFSDTALIWTSPGSQSVATPGKMDPLFTSTRVNVKIVKNGKFRIQKLDEDTGNAVAGAVFRVEAAGVTRNYTTGANGFTQEIEVVDGTKVKATEISVPSPYILASTTGGSNVVEGTVKANETLTLTKRNKKAVGQITINKVGLETGTDLWNGHYKLDGNVFEIRKDSQTGPVVKTITTDASSYAETTKDLPLGTYWVVEKQASQGFANTFKPVKVELTYANQTTAVVVKNAKGTNQEVTGSTVLTKQDLETAAQTQGRASFKGAEYALFHTNGTPVKWSDNFKPVLTHGTKLSGDNVVIRIDDNQKAGVKHLALGNYYWKETKAPEGYLIDPTQHDFALTYKDQNTQVVSVNATSKEKVVKFNLEGFKYVTSSNGSTTSGYNGIKFDLTPISPTKGEKRSVTTKTDANGYDGAWNFSGIPYGDYKITEDGAPAGYELIKPLILKSSFNATSRVYTFTITEEGSNEPLKVVEVKESAINTNSATVSLGKLFLYNNKPEIPDIPEIESDLLMSSREKDFDPTVDQKLVESVKTKYDKLDLDKTFYYVSQFHRVRPDGTSTVIGTKESKQEVTARNLNFKVNFDYKAGMVDFGDKIVATQVIYEDAAHTKEYARHFDFTNEDQTVLAVENEKPSIETLFVTTLGEKDFDPTVNQTLLDTVKNEFTKRDLGKTFYWRTQFHKIAADGKSSVVGTVDSDRKVEERKFTFDVNFAYKANTLKAGEKLVATHVLYTDKERTKEYARHYDLKNRDQTLLAKENPKPEIETLFVTTKNEKDFDYSVDNILVDKVKNSFDKRDLGKTFYWTTAFHRVDADGNSEIIGSVDSTRKVEKEKFNFNVDFEYKAFMLEPNQKLVATHILYTDAGRTKEYTRHYDLENEDQTLVGLKNEEPKIKTLFVTTKDEKDFDPLVDQILVDKVENEFTKRDLGKTLYWTTEFHKILEDGTSEVVGAVDSEHTVEKLKFEFDVEFEYTAKLLTAGENLVATHVLYYDAERTREYTRHYDLEDKGQTLLAKENEKPAIKTLFVTTKDEKDFDPTVDQVLVDLVDNVFATRDIGKTFYWTTNFHKVKVDGTNEIVGTVESERLVETEKFDFNVDFEYTANMLEHGEKLVATHILYVDAEREEEYTRHFDLENEDQTLLAKENDKPLIETLFVTTDGETKFDPTKDQPLVDQVFNEFAERDLGKTFYYVTQFHKIDAEGKDTVVGTVESEQKIEKQKFDFDVTFDYKANTLLHKEKLVATHIVYTDKEHENEYARHFDLTNRKQTLLAINPELPSIETLFVTKDGKKEFDPTKDHNLIDKVKVTVPIQDIGKTFYYVTEFHKIDVFGNESVIGRDESEHKATDKEFEFDAIFAYKANTLKDGERLVATHKAYTDKDHENEYDEHYDLTNLKQTLTAKTPATPAQPTKGTSTPGGKTLPRTNGTLTNPMMLVLVVVVASCGAAYFIMQKRNKEKEATESEEKE